MSSLFSKKNKFLVIAAHPDDEVLGLGGILALAQNSKIKVTVLFIGEGISARFKKNQFGSQDYQKAHEIRQKGCLKALKFLDINNIIFKERYCCRFDSYDILDIVKDIEEVIIKEKPTHIFTHNPIEVNVDHRITYQAVETATRPLEGVFFNSIFTFEIPCSGNWVYENQFKPNVYVDITSVWDIKLKVWSFYKGEDKPFPFPRSNLGLQTLARYRGMQSGVELAEGIRLVRQVIK